MPVEQNNQAAWTIADFWLDISNIKGIEVNIMNREMYLYVTTAQKTTATQFLYFTSRKTQHPNTTIQSNAWRHWT
jgi:hypothetical protein